MVDLVLTEKRGPIAIVRLNRKDKFNALSNEMRDAIENTFNDLAADSSVRAAVLSHNGPHFSVGYDLEEVIATRLASFNHRALEYHCSVYEFPKPLVGAYSGFALAGGFDLALGADLILAGKRAVFGHPEIKFGAPPLVVTLARKIGPDAALKLIWRAGQLPAKRALEHGIVDEIWPEEELLDRAVALAGRLGSHDPQILALTKRMAGTLFLGDVRENLRVEFEAFVRDVPREPLLDNIKKYYDGLRVKQGPEPH